MLRRSSGARAVRAWVPPPWGKLRPSSARPSMSRGPPDANPARGPKWVEEGAALLDAARQSQ
eukprot:347561-Pyramimonas_sp.AAC.1